MLSRFRRWRHSLSVTLIAVGCALTVFGFHTVPEDGSALYDFLMNTGPGALLIGLGLLLNRYLYEEKSDPTKPPE